MKKGVCKHFNGQEKCLAGVDFRVNLLKWENRKPCRDKHNSDIPCNKYEEPTEQEILNFEAEENGALATIKHVAIACKKIQEKHPFVKPVFEPMFESALEGAEGYIDCPKCGKALYYSVSSLNHHIHGKCETEDCLSWMM